ncbi:unnamed protein product [Vitrella brassicaformis CCMP3155]|uniref:Methyltransferase small domain-containing protein n=1 Tax=Vitrella brassicaformis (strain CCMP3155) TaxID=1169540 RepID=A0A0G4EMY3_VITBC|nr:unnamed protein product [Vitrella brassicaformis CCMP3155]|mmetsp:Transcript_45514/g.128476  ORF Transcript_45514/g.128476 Transcript_45514/m.128476 type:complete len:231 (+) Transcript_45514:92-784(+)|eukprot:CEL98377.1 unnamed protein product [Vitrella brassicaformis CCMP3155]
MATGGSSDSLQHLFFPQTSLERFTFTNPSLPGGPISLQCLPADEGQVSVIGKVLWPAATALAHFLIEHQYFVRGKRVAELGCGIGLVGIAARRLGAAHVLLTDGDAAVVALARENAINDVVECERLIWGEGVPEQWRDAFDVVLAADVIYGVDGSVCGPLIDTVSRLVKTDGTGRVLVAAHRLRFDVHADVFVGAVRGAGLRQKEHLVLDERGREYQDGRIHLFVLGVGD